MAKVLVFGAGNTGLVIETSNDVTPGSVITHSRADIVTERDVYSRASATFMNSEEEFIVRSFASKDGLNYLVAEHGVDITDNELEERIFVMKAFKKLP